MTRGEIDSSIGQRFVDVFFTVHFLAYGTVLPLTLNMSSLLVTEVVASFETL